MPSRRYLLGLCLSLVFFSAEARTKEIAIHTQDSFDALPVLLNKSQGNGYDEIIIRFDKGTFYFGDKHLRLDELSFPGTAIRFIGQGTVLTAKGEDYRDGDLIHSPIEARTGIVSESGDVFLWSNVYHSDGKVQVVDKNERLCRLKCNALKKSRVGDFSSCYILLTEWYLSKMMKVTEVKDGEVFFIADEEMGFLNADYDYAHIYPRFKLLNTKDAPFFIQDNTVHLSQGLDQVHVCRAGRLLTAFHASFKSISFEGFVFLGNQDEIYPLMDFAYIQTEGISISNCEFCGLRSKLVQAAYTTHFSFSNNNIHDCYRCGVSSLHSSKTRITNNVFHNVGLAMSNDFSIVCADEDYLVSDNLISDFGYGGIGVGLHFTVPRQNRITGTVRNNELWYSQSYFADYPSHTLMDSGAIYAWTQHDRCVIRDNFIHDYTGMLHNRGIFLDDGASHIIVTNNTVVHVPNGWSIDSRLVREVETIPGSQVTQANVGVLIHGNKVDGKIRFEKRK